MTTHYGEPPFRGRSHSIDREINVRECDLYKDLPPPSLFYG